MKKEGIQFLETLFDLLENPLYSKILGWSSDDNLFEIRNIELFISVIPLFLF